TKKNSTTPAPGSSSASTFAVEKKWSAKRPDDARIFSPESRKVPSAWRWATVLVAASEPPASFSELHAAYSSPARYAAATCSVCAHQAARCSAGAASAPSPYSPASPNGMLAISATDGDAPAIASIACTASSSEQPSPPSATANGARRIPAECSSATLAAGYVSCSSASRWANAGSIPGRSPSIRTPLSQLTPEYRVTSQGSEAAAVQRYPSNSTRWRFGSNPFIRISRRGRIRNSSPRSVKYAAILFFAPSSANSPSYSGSSG